MHSPVIESMVAQFMMPPTPQLPRGKDKPQKQYSPYVSEQGPIIHRMRR